MSANITGVLLLDKPEGLTSNQALQKVKHLVGAKKAGHTGSLDPKATGMLAICLGQATGFSQYLLESDKEYLVEGQLGAVTPSGDSETEITQQRPFSHITREQVEAALQDFRGQILQTPPMYSAIKVQGSPLYRLARKGVTVAREPRQVTVYSLNLEAFQEGRVTLRMRCSKGTYVRTIITDLGEKLGCGAYVTKLRRLAIGPYSAHEMVTLEELSAKIAAGDNLASTIKPVSSILQNLQTVVVTQAMQYYLRHGNSILAPQTPDGGLVQLVGKAGELVGVGEVLANGKIGPCKLMRVNN